MFAHFIFDNISAHMFASRKTWRNLILQFNFNTFHIFLTKFQPETFPLPPLLRTSTITLESIWTTNLLYPIFANYNPSNMPQSLATYVFVDLRDFGKPLIHLPSSLDPHTQPIICVLGHAIWIQVNPPFLQWIPP